MSDYLARADDSLKKAEKMRTSGCLGGLLGGDSQTAAKLYENAAMFYNIASSYDKAGSASVEAANCYLKCEDKLEAVRAYSEAATCFKRAKNVKGAISCLDRVVNQYSEVGSFRSLAHYFQEMAGLYESEQNFVEATVYYDRAAELFKNEGLPTSSISCREKVAALAAKQEKYQEAIEIYEEIAQYSFADYGLKHQTRGHLFNAGICHLFQADLIALTKELAKYKLWVPEFSHSFEHKHLVYIAAAKDEGDVAKFTGAAGAFRYWNADQRELLSRLEEKIKSHNERSKNKED